MADNDNRVADGQVVSLEYTLRLDDGEIADSSAGGTPLQFVQGSGQIIHGLEQQLYGMSVGDEKTVTVPAADAYGEIDPEAFLDVPQGFFPEDMDLEPGIHVRVQDAEGHVYEARVAELQPEGALLDFNHPLAGQTLHFDVKVVDLRPATAEEQSHGHVHGGDGSEEA